MIAAFLPPPLGEGWGEGGLRVAEASAKYNVAYEVPLVRGFDLLATAPGGAARLRALIVSLALSGRLTSHRARSSPAPSDVWPVVSLSDLGPSFQNGASSRGDIGGVPTTVIRLADITAGEINPTDPRALPIRASDSAKYMLKQGDILVIRVNGSADLVGRFIVCRSDMAAIHCDHFIRMRFAAAVVVPEYMRLVGDSASVRASVASLFVSTAGQKTVNQRHVGSIKMILPPLAEQRRIVARVGELMKLCDALEQSGRLADEQHARLTSTLFDALAASASAHALAENWQRIAEHFDLLIDRPEAIDALEQTILQLAASGRLVPQEIEAGQGLKSHQLLSSEGSLFEAPSGWRWVTLGQLSSLVTSGSRSWKHYYAKEGSTFIRSQDIKADRLEFDNRAFVKLPRTTEGLRTQVQLLDMLVTITGANVGKAAVLSESLEDAYVSQHVALIRLREPRMADFVHLWLVNAYGGRKLLLASSYGAKPGLNLKNIKDLPVPLPPLAEQRRIVARVEELRRLCAHLRERVTAARRTQSQLAEALVAEVG